MGNQNKREEISRRKMLKGLGLGVEIKPELFTNGDAIVETIAEL